MSEVGALNELIDAQGWRRMAVGPTDRTSETRTPIRALRPIPDAARQSFAPYVELLPGLRIGESDLTRIAPGRPQAQGDVIEVSGRILDRDGRPLRGLLVEMWGANKWGRYTHVNDPAREPLDPNFLGFGRALTDDGGVYRFRTIRPASYLVRPDIGRWRPAHLHFSLRGGSSRLITQMYFVGDSLLDIDPGYGLLGEAQPRHLAQAQASAPSGVDEALTFDMVVGGRSPTMFEA